MQELLARGQMVSAGGRKPRPSEAKENAELEGRRGGGARLGCCHGASKTGRVGRLCSQGRLERGMMGWGPGELLPLSSFFTGGGVISPSLSLSARPPLAPCCRTTPVFSTQRVSISVGSPGKLEPPSGPEQVPLTWFGDTPYSAGSRLGK